MKRIHWNYVRIIFFKKKKRGKKEEIDDRVDHDEIETSQKPAK